jgi:hypothetical protein
MTLTVVCNPRVYWEKKGQKEIFNSTIFSKTTTILSTLICYLLPSLLCNPLSSSAQHSFVSKRVLEVCQDAGTVTTASLVCKEWQECSEQASVWLSLYHSLLADVRYSHYFIYWVSGITT